MFPSIKNPRYTTVQITSAKNHLNDSDPVSCTWLNEYIFIILNTKKMPAILRIHLRYSDPFSLSEDSKTMAAAKNIKL